MNQNANRFDLAFLAPFGIFAVSAAALVNAYIAEYVFDLEPCILCLYQRVPYAVAGVLGLLALTSPRVRVWAVAAAGGVFLAGAAIAFYHVGVEQHWWASAAGCGGAGVDKGPATVEDLQRMLKNLKPVKPCDEVDWTLFGLSMATYNVPTSLALAVGSFWGAARMRQEVRS